jgi:hypothetical protein
VDPLVACKRHPLYPKPFNFFSAQDTRNGNPDHPVFSRSPHHEYAVLSVKPARKIARSEPFFSARVQKLTYEPALCATVAIVVYQFRLVRLLIPCYQSCTCNKRQLGSSFTLNTNLFFICSTHIEVDTWSRRPNRLTTSTLHVENVP